MEDYIGFITMFAGNYAPKGWVFCHGQLMSVVQNQALFSILGVIYGGNGTTSFGIPDLRGRILVGHGQGPGLSRYTIGAKGGVGAVKLLPAQMPAHKHVPMANRGAANKLSATDHIWATEASGVTALYRADAPDAQMKGTALEMTGGGEAHYNMQPYLAISHIICVEGLYPPKN